MLNLGMCPFTTIYEMILQRLEKENIDLILAYEKNASEYYDAFGR